MNVLRIRRASAHRRFDGRGARGRRAMKFVPYRLDTALPFTAHFALAWGLPLVGAYYRLQDILR